MKKTVVLLIVMFLSVVTVLVIAQNKNSSKSVWNYEVPQAPYGYDKGKLIITDNNNSISGEVEISSGYKIKMNEVSLIKDTLKGVVYIDNELVRLKGNVKDTIIVGTADTSMGLLKFRAIKEVNSN